MNHDLFDGKYAKYAFSKLIDRKCVVWCACVSASGVLDLRNFPNQYNVNIKMQQYELFYSESERDDQNHLTFLSFVCWPLKLIRCSVPAHFPYTMHLDNEQEIFGFL